MADDQQDGPEFQEREYRSRGFRSDLHQQYVTTLLKQLAKYEAETDPVAGDASAKGKDHAAFAALSVAADLIDAVAGWAIDHVHGLSMAERKMLPLQPNDAKSHPDYIDYRAFADSHDLEKAGGKQRTDLSAAQKQVLLRNLLFAFGGKPYILAEAWRSMDALAAGDTPAIFKPKRTSNKRVSREESLALLSALTFVHFINRADGVTMTEAYKRVAQAFAMDVETLRGWGKRLPQKLGKLEVARSIEFATNAASWLEVVRKKGASATDDEKQNAQAMREKYGEDALASAVARYKAARIVADD